MTFSLKLIVEWRLLDHLFPPRSEVGRAHTVLGIEKIFKENLVLVVILILEYKALY